MSAVEQLNSVTTDLWNGPVSFFQNVCSPGGVQRNLSVSDLARMLGTHDVRERKDGPLFSFAIYRSDNVHRCDAGVLGLSGIVLDIDNAAAERLHIPITTPPSFAAALSGIAYGVYSTHSNTPGLPKWRLWLPLALPVAPASFRHVFSGLLALLSDDQNIDRSSGDLSRAYYLPSTTKDGREVAFAQFFSGQLAHPERFAKLSRSGASDVDVESRNSSGRNNKLKDIASAMIARGENNETIVLELLSVDQRFGKPLFLDASEGYDADPYTNGCAFVANIRKSMNRARLVMNESPFIPNLHAAPAPPTTSPQFKVADISAIGSAQLPAQQFIFRPLIPRGQVTLLGAHGGVGKSTLALLMAAHVACGQRWAGFEPGSAGETNVAFLSLEDSQAVVLSRLRHIAEEYGLDQTILSRRLRVVDGSESDGALMSESSTAGVRHLMKTASFHEFRELVRTAEFIVVDNASDAFDGNENDRRMVRFFIRSLAQISRENNAGFLMLTHIDKASAKFGAARNSYSGSTAWHNSARSRLAMNLQDDGTIVLVQEKSNYAALSLPVALVWSARQVLVPKAMAATASVQPLLDAGDDLALLDALRAAENAGCVVPAARSGPSTAQRVLCTLPELPSTLAGTRGRERFWRAVERLRRSGKIAIERYRDASRHERQRIVLVRGIAAACGDPPLPPAN